MNELYIYQNVRCNDKKFATRFTGQSSFLGIGSSLHEVKEPESELTTSSLLHSIKSSQCIVGYTITIISPLSLLPLTIKRLLLMLLSNVDWIIRWKVIALCVWLLYLEVMVEENCTETRDDKPEEKGERWNLWNVEGVENCRQNNCSSVRKYDRKETSIKQIPWQFFCFPHHFVKNFSVVYDVLPFLTITVRCGRAPWTYSTHVMRATRQHSQNQLPEPRR